MGPRTFEIDEEFGYRFGYYRATTVGVDGVWCGAITVHGRDNTFFSGRQRPEPDVRGQPEIADKSMDSLFLDLKQVSPIGFRSIRNF
jgi:hypothetical protein